jgi:hypothetical protein
VDTSCLPNAYEDKDISQPASDGLRGNVLARQKMEENASNELEEGDSDCIWIMCVLAAIAIVLLLIGNYVADSHFFKLTQKYEGLEITPVEQLKDLHPPQAVTAEVETDEGQTVLLLAQNTSGLYAFECAYRDSLITAGIIKATAIFISLLLLALALRTMRRKGCEGPLFHVSCFGLLISLAIIIGAVAMYWSITKKINLNSQSAVVRRFAEMIERKDGEIPISLDALSEQQADYFSKEIYYSGGQTPDAINKKPGEWILAAPRDCPDSGYLHLAIVMSPFKKGYAPCLRIMPGSEINEMISKNE